MKTYTEEQVLKFINDNFDEGCSELIGIPPIELPSDEEISDVAIQTQPFVTRKAFRSGAKYVIDKILKNIVS